MPENAAGAFFRPKIIFLPRNLFWEPKHDFGSQNATKNEVKKGMVFWRRLWSTGRGQGASRGVNDGGFAAGARPPNATH